MFHSLETGFVCNENGKTIMIAQSIFCHKTPRTATRVRAVSVQVLPTGYPRIESRDKDDHLMLFCFVPIAKKCQRPESVLCSRPSTRVSATAISLREYWETARPQPLTPRRFAQRRRCVVEMSYVWSCLLLRWLGIRKIYQDAHAALTLLG